MTVHHWGEDPAGTWSLRIEDHIRDGSPTYSQRRGRFLSWSLILYGIAGERPNHHGNSNPANEVHHHSSAVGPNSDSSEQARHVGSSEVKELMEKEEESSDSVQIQSKDENAEKRNDRRRKWLLKKGLDSEDVDFLIALFETEEKENGRKSTKEDYVQRKKSEIRNYRSNWHYGGSLRNQDNWWRGLRGSSRDSYWSPSRRNAESVKGDKPDHQRIVDQESSDDDDTHLQTWRKLVDDLTAILKDE